MKTRDINIFESGDGGELIILNDDLLTGEALFNQVYLALFGGNYEQKTKINYIYGEERFDWWGNSLIFNQEPKKQFNSVTEKKLNEIVLNANGRLILIQTITDDLLFLSDLLNYKVDVLFFEINKIKIIVNFTSKLNQENRVLILIYNNAKNELIIEKTI